MITLLVIAGLVFLILAHEFGHFVAARIFKVSVEEFGIGYPPRIWGKVKNGVMWSINALPFGGFVKITGEDGGSNDPHSFSNAKVWKRMIILAAGVFMNLVVAWIFFSGVFMSGSPERVMIIEVAKNSPATEVGITKGDMVISMRVDTAVLEKPNADEFISFTKKNAGKVIELEISRAGKPKTISVTPRENPPEGEGALGVAVTNAGFKKQSVFSALWSGLLMTGNVIVAIVLGLVHFFGSIFSPGAFDSVSGPIGVVKTASNMAEFGLAYVFQIMALISVNLAILNIIPFPALDGGRILFLAIEKLRGKPLHPRFEQVTNMVGFLALILLMIIVTFRDITQLFS